LLATPFLDLSSDPVPHLMPTNDVPSSICLLIRFPTLCLLTMFRAYPRPPAPISAPDTGRLPRPGRSHTQGGADYRLTAHTSGRCCNTARPLQRLCPCRLTGHTRHGHLTLLIVWPDRLTGHTSPRRLLRPSVPVNTQSRNSFSLLSPDIQRSAT